MNGTVARELLAGPIPGSATEAVSAGEALLAGAAEAVLTAGDDASLQLDGQSWLPAVDPPVMRDCVAFKEYLVNASARAGGLKNPAHHERPGFYRGSVSGLIGHEAVGPWLASTQWMDYELKQGFVVGRPGRNLTPEEAPSHLFDLQRLQRPGHPVQRDAAAAGPGQGQGLRDGSRPLDHDGGRAGPGRP